MDKKDRQISLILQRLYDHYHESDNIHEQHGLISRSAFCYAAGRYLPNATDQRTRDNLWRVAHEREYLSPAPLTRTFNGLLTGQDKSYVKSEIWAAGGRIEVPALDELHEVLAQPARARS
ncbi:hypothetical protein [Methanomassiliicoccus luminyensis]|uniref:hypothetical protein n=1 Tax=Methanomassiliicoccus luminyensis TaxID=1080712 RepID=UPI00036C56E9|nr:hypothetical protein [Methanomassiliicoccus luminyensis]